MAPHRIQDTVAPASGRHPTDEVRIRSRERLPHWERDEAAYFVTFRLSSRIRGSQPLSSTRLLHFDGLRYRLNAWCVMPNHVHVVFSSMPARTPTLRLSKIVKSWKSYTAKEANRLLTGNWPTA
jgi:hypothetical protein